MPELQEDGALNVMWRLQALRVVRSRAVRNAVTGNRLPELLGQLPAEIIAPDDADAAIIVHAGYGAGLDVWGVQEKSHAAWLQKRFFQLSCALAAHIPNLDQDVLGGEPKRRTPTGKKGAKKSGAKGAKKQLTLDRFMGRRGDASPAMSMDTPLQTPSIADTPMTLTPMQTPVQTREAPAVSPREVDLLPPARYLDNEEPPQREAQVGSCGDDVALTDEENIPMEDALTDEENIPMEDALTDENLPLEYEPPIVADTNRESRPPAREERNREVTETGKRPVEDPMEELSVDEPREELPPLDMSPSREDSLPWVEPPRCDLPSEDAASAVGTPQCPSRSIPLDEVESETDIEVEVEEFEVVEEVEEFEVVVEEYASDEVESDASDIPAEEEELPSGKEAPDEESDAPDYATSFESE